MAQALAERRREEIRAAFRMENARPLCVMQGNSTMLRWAGIPFADFCAAPLKAMLATIPLLKKLSAEEGESHGFNSVGIVARPDLFLLQLYPAKVCLPGRDYDADTIWYVREIEMMKKDDYRILEREGYDALFRRLLPQMVDEKEYDGLMARVPADTAAFETALTAAGFVIAADAAFVPQVPFEVLSGLRGFPRLLLDCYRDLNMVQAASDRIFAAQKATALARFAAEERPTLAGWIGGWRSSPAFLPPHIWDALVWPYLWEIGNFMLAAGKVPVFHLDMCWDREIHRFADFPAFVLHTDGSTDLVRARRLFGGRGAFMGDIPGALLVEGKPRDVEMYVERRLDAVGPKGFVVCPGCDSPNQTPYANIAAMARAVARWH